MEEIQEKTKYCKYCGKQIVEDAVMCVHCGRQVEILKSDNSSSAQPNVIINNTNTNYYGGAIYYSKNILNIDSCVFIDNSALKGCDIYVLTENKFPISINKCFFNSHQKISTLSMIYFE